LPHLLPHIPYGYWASNLIAFSPRRGCLVCGCCSSGRNFAYSFLQIPRPPGHPCCSTNGSRHNAP
ncbi:MAG: hypothetical protein ABSC57_08490, partial [Syntrophales bacterium]